MKRTASRMLALLVLLSVLLTACGQPAESAHEPEMSPPDEPMTPLVIDYQMEQGSFTDEFGDTMEYSYAVPQLTDDTQGAAAINEQLDLNLGSDYAVAQEDMAQGVMPGVTSIQWESYQCGPVLSLVVEEERMFEGTMHYAYAYDVEEGVWLDPYQVAEWVGVDEGTYLDALGRAVARQFDLDYRSMAESDGMETAVAELRAATLSEQNLMQAQPWVDEEGVMHAVVQVNTPAGGGYYTQMVTLDLEPEQNELVLESEFATASVWDDLVTVTFHQTPGQDLSSCLEYETPYAIDGMYGQYWDGLLCDLSGSHVPGQYYLFLIDTEGQLTYCDLSNAAVNSRSFVADGPIPLPGVVQSLELDGNGGLWALFDDNSQMDLTSYLWQRRLVIPPRLAESSWDYGDDFWLTCTPGTHEGQLHLDTPDGLQMDGIFFYTGMTGRGMQYRFQLAEEGSSEISEGLLEFYFYPPSAGDMGSEALHLVHTAGPTLPGMMEREGVVLTQVYG